MNNNEPRFTVIIPTYNRAHFLNSALESVFLQCYKNYEVIVIDDGSIDNTNAVLSKYAKNIKVIRQANSGPSAARNCGINSADGEYIAFLDSDDKWFPWTLLTYRKAIIQGEAPVGILGSPYEFSADQELHKVSEISFEYQVHADCFSTFMRDTWFATTVTVLRHDYIQSVKGFRTELDCYEDLDLWLRLGIAPRLVQVMKPYTLAYRRHDSTLSMSANKSKCGALSILESERQGLYPGGPTRRKERREIVCRLARATSVGLARRRWLRQAWAVYLAGFMQQVLAKRWRYLLGFPFISVVAWMKGGGRVGRA